MSDLNFKGNLENLSEIQIQFLTNVLKKRGFIGGKVIAEPVGKIGDNYVADVLRLTAENENGDTFKMIVKVAPKNPTVRTMMLIEVLFRNEHLMYTEILPKLSEQEEIAGVPKNERFKIPLCYDTLLETPNEMIVLEDLKESNFVILDRMQSMPNEAVKLSFERLAKLHSLSYAMKDKTPELYKSLKQKLTSVWQVLDTIELAKEHHKKMEEEVIEVINDARYNNIIKGTLGSLSEIAVSFSGLDAESATSVIHQGDCWTNNIMFKLEDGKPKDCIMIDYQLSKEANPAIDLLYLIFNCTGYEITLKHYHEWIDCYYTSLSDHLTYFGLKVNRIYPREQLDSDLKRHGRLGLAIGIMFATMLVRESKDAIDVKSDTDMMNGDVEKAVEKYKLSSMNEETLSRFKKKILELVDTVKELNLII